jgi:beta-glucosidase
MTTPASFPPGFLWGVASAGHQNEGDNTASDTWFAEHVTPSVFREPSGRACDGWNRWQEDVGLAAGLGLDAFRFSVEWARVETSPGEYDAAALDHYEAIVDECLARGLAPIVTYNHFTAPHWFAMRGSWLADDAPERFAAYCDVVTRRFGDRISQAITLNEPNLPRLLSWLHLPDFVRDLERGTLAAASAAAGVTSYRLANVMVPEEMDAFGDAMTAGHRVGRAAIKAVRPDLPVGFSLAVVDDVVVGDDASVRDRKRGEVYQRWLELAREDDFLGVQNYERITYDGAGEVEPAAEAPRNAMGSAVEPESLAGAVRYAHDVAGVPILVTEHGISTSDDALRVGLLEPSLRGLATAMADGVPVLGYCHWTLMDNFEWVFGYTHQLGLYSVDRTTFARTPKPSAHEYARLVAALRSSSGG